jgi:NADH-quinone oxidoreductase subunit H
MGIFGVMLSGWSSNSKYAFLGSLRSAAQMISYEVSIGLILVIIGICSGSLNILSIVFAQQQSGWYILPLFPLVFIFFVSMLAETNRAPFDLPEAEAELVAGFNVEYSSITFALFFLGEYCNMILMATLMVILFFGGWLCPVAYFNFIPSEVIFATKIIFFCFMFILALTQNYH